MSKKETKKNKKDQKKTRKRKRESILCFTEKKREFSFFVLACFLFELPPMPPCCIGIFEDSPLIKMRFRKKK